MKPGIARLMDGVVALVLLAAGGWLLYASWFNQRALQGVFDLLRNSPFYSTAIGIVLIEAVLLRLAASKYGQKRGAFVDFQSEEGTVGISAKAICDFINRVGNEFEGVKSIDSRLIERRGAVDIALSAKIHAGHKLPELSRAVQTRVRESVRESLGLEDIGRITFKVQEIVGSPVKSTPKPEAAHEEAF